VEFTTEDGRSRGRFILIFPGVRFASDDGTVYFDRHLAPARPSIFCFFLKLPRPAGNMIRAAIFGWADPGLRSTRPALSTGVSVWQVGQKCLSSPLLLRKHRLAVGVFLWGKRVDFGGKVLYVSESNYDEASG
jgi:hypothetical protein